MIALVLTAFIVMGTWRFFASASDSMSVFTGVSIVDERLALASDLIASDIRRAGMYGTPHSDADPMVCPKPAQPLRAVMVDDGASLPGYTFGNNAFVDPDVCMFLAPVTSALLNPVQVSGATILFSALDPDIPGTAADFDALLANRTFRITSPGGFNQFVDVAETNFGARSVVVTPPPTTLESNGVCGIEGIGGQDHEIAVLTRVRYRIVAVPDSDETVLLREELNPQLSQVLPGTRLVVAENIVDLQCWGDRDAGAGLAGPDFAADTALGDDVGTADLTMTSADTQRLRIVHFTVSGRTDREFSSYSHRAKEGLFDLMSTWDVDGDASSAALTLTVGQQVEVSSLVVRRLQ